MSPPPRGWRIRGAANYKSVARAAVNPRRAFAEWLALAEAIESAGGSVNVVPPPGEGAEVLTGLMYTANAGWLRDGRHFRLAHLSVPHRQREAAYLEAKLKDLFGWEIEESGALWEGQADMCRLSDSMVLLSYGVRSTRESVDEVAALLPPSVNHRAVRLREPFFHGDTCMDLLRGQRPVFLVFPSAFADHEEYRRVRETAAAIAEVVEISEQDALGYACNSLSLGDELLVPAGLSESLRRTLAERGYRLRELDFTELFGKGGGGPRCLVNELMELDVAPGASRFAALAPSLRTELASYPAEQLP
jgi:N-dimethylarginine dimethylaminohydrolase